MKDIIKLNDLLKLTESEIDISKIKFNQSNGIEDPMEVYLRDPDIINNQWLFWRKEQRYFKVGQIAICFLKLSYDTWLLTTIKNVTKDLNLIEDINYEGVEIEKYRGYFGRVKVRYHKRSKGQGFNARTILDELEVLEILPSVFDGDHFTGYDKVSLSFNQLENILQRRKSDWIAALEHQKGIYLVVDKSNGKMYVGSAYGDNGMLLDRWQKYINTGHGNNAELYKVIQQNGIEYARQNFHFTILENYNSRVNSNLIIERESWWKTVLLSRVFGYNSN